MRLHCPLAPALWSTFIPLLPPLQAAYQQLEEAQASAAHPVTLNLTVADAGVSATHAAAVSAELTPSPAHQAFKSAVVAAAEALLALGCDAQQLKGAGWGPMAEVGTALQALWLLLASVVLRLEPLSPRSAVLVQHETAVVAVGALWNWWAMAMASAAAA